MVKGNRKDGKGEIARLVGKLMKRSAKLHPSVPSGGGILRTAPIREVHLDLVRVTTGLHFALILLDVHKLILYLLIHAFCCFASLV